MWLPPLPKEVKCLITQRIDSAPLCKGVTNEDMEALDSRGHAAGTDPVNFVDIAQRRSIIEITHMCVAIGRGKFRICT
jgi:hypothetical protein